MAAITIGAEHIDVATETVRRELGAKLDRSSTARPGQALASELLDLVVSQSVIPILVAVTSTRLSDILKDRRLKKLKRADAEEAALQLIGADLGGSTHADPAALVELRKLLTPYGLSDGEIDHLVEQVWQSVTR